MSGAAAGAMTGAAGATRPTRSAFNRLVESAERARAEAGGLAEDLVSCPGWAISGVTTATAARTSTVMSAREPHRLHIEIAPFRI